MLKQITAKSVNPEISLIRLYKEVISYLNNIGFKKTPILSATNQSNTLRYSLFEQGNEKVLLGYKKDDFEEVLTLTFNPLDIKFVYDILLMRFNQVANQEINSIYVFSS